jgi:hypothetical protein
VLVDFCDVGLYCREVNSGPPPFRFGAELQNEVASGKSVQETRAEPEGLDDTTSLVETKY